MNNKYYITTAIPYVNAAPHVGHALEFIQADTIARYHKLLGEDVLLLSGGDENALKNVQAAEQAGEDIQKFIDRHTELFRQLAKRLNIHFDVFQKGSDKKHHFPSSQRLWELCYKNGDIYKKSYKGLYCVGCETFYSSDELDKNGECFEHPGKKLEEIEEENYFFRLSKYQDKLIELIKKDEYTIIPDFRKNETLQFLTSGLKDLSISRSNQRAHDWGVPVPNDSTQRIYVWFDALNIYQSGIGFGWDEEQYKKWWPADLHVIGKGISRFHTVYWPAFLLSAGLHLPKKVFIHEYFTVNGQKMSKTLGNVYDPHVAIEKYGVDALRYYCLAKISPFQDGDFSEEKLVESYNADLANGIGNLVARVAKLLETNNIPNTTKKPTDFSDHVHSTLINFQFNEALNAIWIHIKNLDHLLDEWKPWTEEGLKSAVHWTELISGIRQIAFDLQPFLPETAEKILKQFANGRIKSRPPLFPRI
ncbi:methionine--tRNA ligase [Candidatus Microgenomates bacterium]|nr:methionine--tRNA ligase [Candidatus Microgenomates bacterium]